MLPSINREYTVTEYWTTRTDPKARKIPTKPGHGEDRQTWLRRQTWLPGVDRRHSPCTQKQLEDPTKTSGTHIFPRITHTREDFDNTPDANKLTHLLRDIRQCMITAAPSVTWTSCYRYILCI